MSDKEAEFEKRIERIEKQLFSLTPKESLNVDVPIGSVLLQRRKAYGLTIKQVKDRGGPCIAFQSDVEKGKKTNVGIPTLIRWCKAIGCEPIMVFADMVGLYSKKQGLQ